MIYDLRQLEIVLLPLCVVSMDTDDVVMNEDVSEMCSVINIKKPWSTFTSFSLQKQQY